MQDERNLNSEEFETAEALSRLEPLAPRFQVKDVRAAAATASMRRQVWLWRGIAAALALGLLPAILLRIHPRTVETVVYVVPTERHQQPPAPEPARVQRFTDLSQMTGDNYLSERNQVVAFGWRATTSARSWAPSPIDRTIAPALTNPSPQPKPILDRLVPFLSGGRS